MKLLTVLLAFVGAKGAWGDCQDDGCPTGQNCCLCSCDEGDYAVSAFSCNCDDTKKHKPLPNADQPTCCGGKYGFDAWCVKKDSPAVNNLQCSSQKTSGFPMPKADFYQFGTKHRCVAGQCKSGFCDNPSPPDLSDHICHKPYVPSPAPSSPTPSHHPAPSPSHHPSPKSPSPSHHPSPKSPSPSHHPSPAPSPSPASCTKTPKPDGCPCDHSFQCHSGWCDGKCEPAPSPAPTSPACEKQANRPDGCPCDHSYECQSNWCYNSTCGEHGMFRGN